MAYAANSQSPTELSKLPRTVRAPRGGELEKVIEWRTQDDVGMLHDFFNNPPLRSVVIKFWPAAAEVVLRITNNHNRPMTVKNRQEIEEDLRTHGYELTGDTIKFGKSSNMLDGQHRLEACVKSGEPLESHVLFGLEDDIFDILDRGRRRTPGDILAIAGYKYGALLAGAVRWAKAFEENSTPQHLRLSSREIHKLADKKFKGLQDWLVAGQQVNKAFKHSPSLIAAMLFTISKHDKELANRFAQEWQHGNRSVRRNKNFDVLSSRLQALAHELGGRINHYVRAAMIVNTFNAWNADVEASPRSLSWKLGWKFPSLYFDIKAYKQEAEARERLAELSTNQRLVYVALESGIKPGSDQVKKSLSELSDLTELKHSAISGIVRQLADRGYITVLKEGEDKGDPSTYGIIKDIETGRPIGA